MLEKLIKILETQNFFLETKLIDNFNKSFISKDAIYAISQTIFESNKINHPTRVRCHEELINISKQKKCNFSLAHNLNLASRVYSVLGENRKAIQNDLEALKLWRKIKKDPLAINGQIICYANLGNIYIDLGLYKKSLDYFEKGLKALKKCKNDLIPYVRIHLGFGNVYNKLNRYKKAEQFFIKAYNEARKTKNDLLIIPCELNLIKTKMNYHDYHATIPQCQKILKRLNKINDVNYKPHILSTLGTCYMNLKQYKEAEKYFLDNFNFANKVKSKEQEASSLNELGILYYKMKKFNKALNFFSKSYNLHIQQDSIHSHFEIIKYLSILHEKNGDQTKSLSYYKQYVKQIEKNNKEKDKLFKEDKRRIITGLESELDQIKKEKDILKQEKNKNRTKNSQVSIALMNSTHKEFLEKIIQNIESKIINKDDIIKNIQIKIDDSMDWVDYLQVFEEINQKFIIHLNQYNLTLTEIKICTFIKIGFDNYEISGIMNIGMRGVQQHRYRIKKKLNIDKKLDQFLLAL